MTDDINVIIQRTIAETLKLAAELGAKEQKLRSSVRELETKVNKLHIDCLLTSLAGAGAFIIAAVAVATLIIKLFQGAIR
jgi:hypothetical protein